MADLEWDLANGMLAGDRDTSHRAALLNLRNAARRELETRADAPKAP